MYRLILFIAVLVSSTVGQYALAQDSKEKIEDLRAYLAADEAYQAAEPLARLQILKKLNRSGRTNYNELIKVGTEEAYRHAEQKKDADPFTQLRTWAELYKEELPGAPYQNYHARRLMLVYLRDHEEYQAADARGQLTILAHLRQEESMQFAIDMTLLTFTMHTALLEDAKWQKGTPLERISILKQMEEENLGYVQELIQLEVSQLLANTSADVPTDEQGIWRLKTLAELKADDLISWGNYYSYTEQDALNLHLQENVTFQQSTSRDQLTYLGKLESEKLITPFLRSDTELPIVLEVLRKSEKFAAASNETKVEQIQKLSDDRVIHSFSVRKIKEALGL